MDSKEKIIVIAKKYNKKESLRCFFDEIILDNKEFLILTTNNFKYIKNGKERDKGYRMDLIIFKEKWFNAFVFYKNDKKQKFYFNIASPASIKDKYIEYIDMDIDLVVSSDFKKVEILDMEEFKSHIKEYNYSDFFIKNSLGALEQVKELKDDKNFWKLFK
ncbi:DUF402 domain-containing protein [archaeon]|nr:DUF402 domain-containing protein [archaeon]MDD3919423.1 DUF402 domain-containing protein [Candidatus Paceibacterota bacterium]